MSQINLKGDYSWPPEWPLGDARYELVQSMYLRLNTPLGSWWRDARFGSNLHTIKKATNDAPSRMRQLAEQALQPLVNQRRMRDLSVVVTMSDATSASIDIRAMTSAGAPVQLIYPVRIGG